MNFPQEVRELVDKFNRNQPKYMSKEYHEADVRNEFVDPFFEALGWAMRDSEQIKREGGLRIDDTVKYTDYTFKVANQTVFYVETKKPSVNLYEAAEPAIQLRRYGWNGNIGVGILTNFRQFVVYDCRTQPKPDDGPAVELIHRFTCDEYEKEWPTLVHFFSREAALAGRHHEVFEEERGGILSVDEVFLRDMEIWRQKLAKDISWRNPDLNLRDLNLVVQRTLDRIVFLRIAEDRKLEPYERLLRAASPGKQVYYELKDLFVQADDKYNSGLFFFRPSDRLDSQPDTLSMQISVGNQVLQEIIRRLYYPSSVYNFSVIPADILGQVYERFLSKAIAIDSDTGEATVSKSDTRKHDGIYYTPINIVDLIVQITVGSALTGKTPRQIRKLRILDPACGSGSFLLSAYQLLLDWHLYHYSKNPDSAIPSKIRLVSDDPEDGYTLTLTEKKQILLNNIYGVDLDQNAVEVTKLSLLLKMLEREYSRSPESFAALSVGERILPDLGANIKWGNSLIGSDFLDNSEIEQYSDEEINVLQPFDWDDAQEGFGETIVSGGFDIIIGNPPYIFTRNQGIPESHKEYFYNSYSHQSIQLNTFGLFVERSMQILASSGLLGFIIPNNWLTIESFSELRRHIIHSTSELHIYNILDKVFSDANVDSAIVRFKKGGESHIIVGEISDGKIKTEVTVYPQELTPPEYIIQIELLKDADAKRLVKAIDNVSAPLKYYAKVSTGLKAYQRGKGKPAQTDSQKVERPFHAMRRLDNTFGKYLDGADVRRYSLRWSGQYLRYGEWLAEMRKSVPFDGSRILVRQIPSHPPYTINAVYIEDQYYNDINSMVIFAPINVSLLYLLGIINSKLISYWFQKKYDKLQRKVFPQFKVSELKQFPVRIINFNDAWDTTMHNKLVSLVKDLLQLNEKVDGYTVIQESLIQRKINRKNREIDDLVYELYGLTPAEIAIVEGRDA